MKSLLCSRCSFYSGENVFTVCLRLSVFLDGDAKPFFFLTGWGLGPARFLKCTLRVFVVADLKIRIWPEFKTRYSRGVMNNLPI